MKRLVFPVMIAGLLVIIFGTIYGVVQQAQRSAANQPQIQLAEDAAAMLKQGAAPSQIITTHVDIAHSLAPFIVIYDAKGRALSSSGYLNNLMPEVPKGILEAAKGHEYHAVTWQPTDTVRIASVSVTAGDKYVLAGRSLREVEKNESVTFQLAALGAVASLLVLAAALWLTKGRLP